jgi:hypothetical protein
MHIAGRSIKVRLKNGKTSQVEVIGPGDVVEALVVAPSSNPAGEIVEAGHGFIVNDPRSRPWKTATRTHCAHCGDELPKPDVSKSTYKCEFDPDNPPSELALVGEGQPKDEADLRWDAVRYMLGVGSPCRHGSGCSCGIRGCKCSGCTIRWQVANGHERSKGQPRMVCSEECGRLRGNEMKRWKAAVLRAQKHGATPPPEPEDKGLKLAQRNGPRSAIEGNGHRYIAVTGLPWSAPRA